MNDTIVSVGRRGGDKYHFHDYNILSGLFMIQNENSRDVGE